MINPLSKSCGQIPKHIGLNLKKFGTDISVIQKLLGHNDLRTTQIYARVSNTLLAKIFSPLNRL